MKPEVATSTAELALTVTPEMTATLGGRAIHPVYATFWLAHHAELAARMAIEPYFDEGENAVGGELSVRHERMVAVGEQVMIRATVTEVRGANIVCAISAFCREQPFAIGSQTQIVMAQERIDRLVEMAYRGEVVGGNGGDE